MKEAILERFHQSISPEPNTGCWYWMNGCERTGYGQFCHSGKVWKAHRLSFAHYHRALEPGEVVHHKCEIPFCVNPDHLQATSQRDNVLLGNAPAAIQARQTHCMRGHELSGENLFVTTDGRRQCLDCSRANARRRYAGLQAPDHRWRGQKLSLFSRAVWEPIGRKPARVKIRKNPKPSFQERFMAKVSPEPNSGCWLWMPKPAASHGYGVIGLGRKVITAHRASWIIHSGEIPDGLWVLHKCDNKLCVNPDHLYLGTVADNARDHMERGKPYCYNLRNHITPDIEEKRIRNLKRGNNHHRSAAKINEEIALKIFNADGAQHKIAKMFGVCQQTVSKIKRKEYWSHIHGDQ